MIDCKVNRRVLAIGVCDSYSVEFRFYDRLRPEISSLEEDM